MTVDSIPNLLIDRAGYRLSLIAESFERLVARPLLAYDANIAGSLWHAPFVIVAHGTEPDPLFFFGNKMALDLFEVSPADFTVMPSRLSAEEGLREERAQLMERVTRDGYIDDYSGVRISATGRRFSIRNAIVWNLMDESNQVHGQAATFVDWTPLD